MSRGITLLFRAVCFSFPHDADIGENRLCDQLKECLCVRQGAGTTVLSYFAFRFPQFYLSKAVFTYIVRSPRFIPIPCLYPVRSPHFLPNPCFIPCPQSAVGILYWPHFPSPFRVGKKRAPDRVFNFMPVCPNYEQGIACTIDWFGLIKFLSTPSIQKQQLYYFNLLYNNCQEMALKQDGLQFVLCPSKQGNIIESIVLNRVCILRFFWSY